MKIQVLSDLHLEFDEFNFEDAGADIVILAGDIHIKDKGVAWAINNIRNTPVLYVLGNHEFYGKAYPKHIYHLKNQAKGTNIHILEKDSYSINGVNFLGCTLWTDFELFGDPRIAGHECQQIMNDFKKIRVSPNYSKLRSLDVTAMHRQSLKWLTDKLETNQDNENIIITHHGPSTLSLSKGYEREFSSAAYASNLNHIIEKYSPSFWFHGHLHHSSNYRIGSCQIICNPRGYPDERNPYFKPKLTVNTYYA
jgi:Icc-related predicted phosphoesterase